MANTSQLGAGGSSLRIGLLILLSLLLATSVRAQLIFDVFVGHGLGVADSTVTEGSWCVSTPDGSRLARR